MNKILLTAVCIACVYNAACIKEDVIQYSRWYVNTDSFTTYDAKTDMGKLTSRTYTNSLYIGGTLTDCFLIVFITGSFDGRFPTSRNFKLDYSKKNPQWVYF